MLYMASGRNAGYTQNNAVRYDAHYTVRQGTWTTGNIAMPHLYLGIAVLMGGTKTKCL